MAQLFCRHRHLQTSHVSRSSHEVDFNQNYPKDKYELIVIDNDSPDDTATVVQQAFTGTPIPCSYHVAFSAMVCRIRATWALPRRSLNLYAQLDDDAIADPDWLAAFNRVINEQHALVVGGRVKSPLNQALPRPIGSIANTSNISLASTMGSRQEKVFRIRHPLYLSGGNTAYAERVIERVLAAFAPI